jgi:hypothetical protein
MARESLFGRWLIDLATTNPPPSRDQWAQAMRAEFEALEGGRTGWALGCLATSVGWRLRANWRFLLAFFAVSTFFLQWISLLFFLVICWLPHDTVRAFGYATNWGALAVASGCFAAARPRHWPAIGIGMALVSQFSIVGWFAYFHFGQPISIRHLHIMDANVDVGIGAELGYSLIGAMIGQSLAGIFRREAPRFGALA